MPPFLLSSVLPMKTKLRELEGYHRSTDEAKSNYYELRPDMPTGVRKVFDTALAVELVKLNSKTCQINPYSRSYLDCL